MCDLAGSERLSKSNATGDRLKETRAINKSLSALADVFAALSSKSSHTPFRNSKLTYLLQPCFTSSGKSMMIVNLSANEDDAPETLCSLRFAKTVNQTELGQAKKHISRTSGGAGGRSGRSGIGRPSKRGHSSPPGPRKR